MALGIKTGGRKAGTPNKVTSQSRQTMTKLVDENIDNLSVWLNSVALGIRKVDEITGLETEEYLVLPNPARAFEIFVKLLEFHVPKLNRMKMEFSEIDVIEPSKKLYELIKMIKSERQKGI